MYKSIFLSKKSNEMISNYNLKCKRSFQEKDCDVYPIFLFCVLCVLIFSMSETFALQTDALKAPMQTLKKEAFDWAFALKIAAGLVGAVTALIKQTPTPFVIGLSSMAGLRTCFNEVV